MEGIEQNPVVYDLMSEMAFHHKPVDVKVIFTFVYPSLYLIEYHPHVLSYNFPFSPPIWCNV